MPWSATVMVATLSAKVIPTSILPSSRLYFTAFDSRLYIILSILSGSNHTLALVPSPQVNTNCCPRASAIGRMLSHAASINSARLRQLTFSLSCPACDFLTSSICLNSLVSLLMLFCISIYCRSLPGAFCLSWSMAAEMTVSGVSNSWVILVNTTAICNLFLVLICSLYHFTDSHMPHATIRKYITNAHHVWYHGGNTFINMA